MGPELSTIGARRSAHHLRESLLDPNASVPEDFLYVMVTTKKGQSFRGTRLHEDTFSILFRDLAGNNHVFQKQDLKEVRKELKKSPMPSYKDKLSEEELTDLVQYLAAQRRGR